MCYKVVDFIWLQQHVCSNSRSSANSGVGKAAKTQCGIKNKRNSGRSIFEHIAQIQRKAKRMHRQVYHNFVGRRPVHNCFSFSFSPAMFRKYPRLHN